MTNIIKKKYNQGLGLKGTGDEEEKKMNVEEEEQEDEVILLVPTTTAVVEEHKTGGGMESKQLFGGRTRRNLAWGVGER